MKNDSILRRSFLASVVGAGLAGSAIGRLLFAEEEKLRSEAAAGGAKWVRWLR